MSDLPKSHTEMVVRMRIKNHRWKRIPKNRREETRAWLRECELRCAIEIRRQVMELASFGTTEDASDE